MKPGKPMLLTILGLFMLAGLAAWGWQYREGLILTHMQNAYTWGLYVSALAFFVGNAAGGLVLSAMIYLFGVSELKPFARMGALAAFANVTAAMLVILPDMGRPLRLVNLLLHPQFMSPLVWDVIVLSLYAALSLLYLYLLMLPDLQSGRLCRIAIRVKDPAAFSDRWARRLAPFSLVAAIGIHVVTAWIFSTQGARDWWHSAAMAPDFVAAALASGTAFVLMVAVLAYGVRRQYEGAYKTLAVFIAAALFVHLFLMYNDFVIHGWYGAKEATGVLSITLREYFWAHLFEVAAPLAGALLLLNRRVRQRAAGMAGAAALVVAGIFVHRFLIMPAAFSHMPLTLQPLGMPGVLASVPIASGRYTPAADVFTAHYAYFPSLVEIAIFLGVLAYTAVLIILALERLPIETEVRA